MSVGGGSPTSETWGFFMSDQDTRTSGRLHVDRRSVLRAGVWTVPAITLATAAPAFAATSGATTGSLQINSLSVYGADYDGKGKATTAETQTSIQNVWTTNGPTLTTIVFSVTYSGGRVDGSAPTLVTGAGWTFSSAVRDGGDWMYTFVWSGSLAPSASTSTLTYRVPLKNSSSGQIGIAATASSAGVQSVSAAASNNL